MEVRCQIASVFVLDLCVGCHACSIACKQRWTGARGQEHAWWTHVEAKPGDGYPTGWEEQKRFPGGWRLDANGEPKLAAGGRWKRFLSLFHDPGLPVLDDYSEPCERDYGAALHRANGPFGVDAPQRSRLTGLPRSPQGGCSWGDDLAGLGSEKDGGRTLNLDSAFSFHLPRICNHCLFPSCSATCPSGAVYKRGEDGIVLIDPERCRGWQACVSGCPYKEIFYDFRAGKAGKCTLCVAQLEDGVPPDCMLSCPAAVHRQGFLLYDSDRVPEVAALPEKELVDGLRSLFLDPGDPLVEKEARRAGVGEAFLEAARRSSLYSWLVEWRLALPLHPEWRTLPMVFYVPPLLRQSGQSRGGEPGELESPGGEDLLTTLFAAGNLGEVRSVQRRLRALRAYAGGRLRADFEAASWGQQLWEVGLSPELADRILAEMSSFSVDRRFPLSKVEHGTRGGAD